MIDESQVRLTELCEKLGCHLYILLPMLHVNFHAF